MLCENSEVQLKFIAHNGPCGYTTERFIELGRNHHLVITFVFVALNGAATAPLKR